MKMKLFVLVRRLYCIIRNVTSVIPSDADPCRGLLSPL